MIVSEKVEALFCGEPPPQPLSAAPRLKSIRTALWISLPLNVFGVFCWTGVPGAAIALWAWLRADAEMDRVRANAFSSEDAAAMIWLRNASGWMLGLCICSLALQTYLLTTSFYGDLWARLFG